MARLVGMLAGLKQAKDEDVLRGQLGSPSIGACMSAASGRSYGADGLGL